MARGRRPPLGRAPCPKRAPAHLTSGANRLCAALLFAAAALLAGCATPAVAEPTVVVAAAGDIACDAQYPDFNDGAGNGTGCHEKATSDVVVKIAPTAVLALGDIQYVHGDPADYAASYDPTWGRFKAITRPTIGNHEGGEGGSNKSYFGYFGQNAGSPGRGYYSFDLEAWHLVSLNSNCGVYDFNGSHEGCRQDSEQEQWLRADLAAHPALCTLAYFHVPRFASGSDHHSTAATDQTLTAIWNDLYAAGVDVVLNGHVHSYERFTPLRPDGTADPQSGVREFVVGTGGDDHGRFGKPVSGSEMRNDDSFGVLRLALKPTSYDWSFVNDGAPGATNTDAGSSPCHR